MVATTAPARARHACPGSTVGDVKHQNRAIEQMRRSGVRAILIASMALGASMLSAPNEASWDPGAFLLVGAAVCALSLLLGRRRRRGPARARISTSDWVALSTGLGAGLLVGLLFFDGSAAFAALFPVPFVAIHAAVSRSGGSLRARSIVLAVTAALVVAILVTGHDLQRGFADLVQGAVVAGVLLTLALVLWSAVRRQQA
ncbi:hypothetical protein NYS50_14510 [Curtobacterium flaccumfaciens pv. flaccumfaciens]|uniref:hypothetical protein n=1 Tax=Curtobacterium flaccumfaciens TaxID=2035 RepID=UPI00217DA569|nr:hypothetical protein [Curtobacterium flaccumfaciens]MCS6549092.1 hypothetical protein [Curtobacterium flaccumfaciens pv. flaccumfaciens]